MMTIISRASGILLKLLSATDKMNNVSLGLCLSFGC
jgi:hypothetical protein